MDVGAGRGTDPEGQQSAAPGEALCHQVAQPRDVRRAPLEERAARPLPPFEPILQQLLDGDRMDTHVKASAWPTATSSSHSRSSSTPSPLRALTRMRRTPGLTASRLY